VPVRRLDHAVDRRQAHLFFAREVHIDRAPADPRLDRDLVDRDPAEAVRDQQPIGRVEDGFARLGVALCRAQGGEPILHK
jgi:hypothetical protein